MCIKDFILFFVISDAIASFEIFLYIGALLPQWNQTRTLSCYILKLLRWYFLTWHSQIQFLMSWSVLAWNKNLYQNLPGIWGCANCWVSPRPMLLLWIFSIWICNSINLTPPFFFFLAYLCPWQIGKMKSVHVVDIPGHSRLRPKLDEFLPQAAGMVFVVDALEFLPNLSAVSE